MFITTNVWFLRIFYLRVFISTWTMTNKYSSREMNKGRGSLSDGIRPEQKSQQKCESAYARKRFLLISLRSIGIDLYITRSALYIFRTLRILSFTYYPHPSFVVIVTPRYSNESTCSIVWPSYWILGRGGATTLWTSSAFVLFVFTGRRMSFAYFSSCFIAASACLSMSVIFAENFFSSDPAKTIAKSSANIWTARFAKTAGRNCTCSLNNVAVSTDPRGAPKSVLIVLEGSSPYEM